MIQVAIEKYKKVQDLNWNEAEKFSGKIVKIKGIPRDKKVKIFWEQSFFQLEQNILLLRNSISDQKWNLLKKLAVKIGESIDQVKHKLLSDGSELSIEMSFNENEANFKLNN